MSPHTSPPPIGVHRLTDSTMGLLCSARFTTTEEQDLAGMAGTGALDLPCFGHRCRPLAAVNTAIAGIAVRHGGFSHFVIRP